MAGKLRETLGESEAFDLSVAIVFHLTTQMPESERDDAVLEITNMMIEEDEQVYQQLLDFEICRSKSIFTSPFKDLYEMMRFRHCVGAVGPIDVALFSG